MMYRKYIRIVEAANKGCPIATHDIDVNLKNRQKAIEESYWKDAARRWSITEKTAKTMKCGNCAAFDVSDKMWACIEDGIKGDEKAADAMATIHRADLGYCNFLHFKCAGDRSCTSWVTGGAIDNKDRTQ
jgi:hypothetical protein